ncbi:MAG: malonyl-CoA synthase, partial [Pseudomonadota bacterium]|nr:malonyl-CoA synthase [Pseudomonadota bacterium]
GEAVVAVVVRDDQGLEAATVETALAGQLAKFKQPKAVLFTDALPRNSMGKVQKAELRKTHTDLFT